MKLTVLGCSGSLPGPDSPASGYLVEADGYRVVLDLGNGAFGALLRHAKPGDVDAVIISHLHADHSIDLTAYVVALRYGGLGYRLEPGAPRVPIIGPAGTRDRLAVAYDPLARKLGLTELFSFATPADGDLGPFQVSYATMNHPVPTTAVRLTLGDRSLVYSADTGESDALAELARGADLFLCEATFATGEGYAPDLHLTGKQAGEYASRAGVGRLVVTHVPPWASAPDAAADAATVFDGPIEIATAGAEYEF